MISKSLTKGGRHQRRAAVAVMVAVLMFVIVGFAALAIDVGALNNYAVDMQKAVDSGAMAGVNQLADYSVANPLSAARLAAIRFTEENRALGGKSLTLADGDIVFGYATYNELANQYNFFPTLDNPNALRLTLRQTQNSPNGTIPLFFARIFGRDSTEMSRGATAAIVPRDITLVVDTRPNMLDDSWLPNYRDKDVNIYEVWDDLPGGNDTDPWDPADVPPGDPSIQAAGPAWGYMKRKGWGSVLASGYNAGFDSGLCFLPKSGSLSDNPLRADLFARGYSNEEVNTIQFSPHDAFGSYDERVAVAMGLAKWYSGIPGTFEQSLWEREGIDPLDAGNGDNKITDNELEWTETILSNDVTESKKIWLQYIKYMESTDTPLYDVHARFQYRYGIKTAIHYLLETRQTHDKTPEWADTREQPMRTVKDAVNVLTTELNELASGDLLELITFQGIARLQTTLRQDYELIYDVIEGMQATHYAMEDTGAQGYIERSGNFDPSGDGFWGLGGGLEMALDQLTDSSRTRSVAKKMVILISDGRPVIDQRGAYYPEGSVQPRAYVTGAAREAANRGIMIFTVSLGEDADQGLMQEIADMTYGEHFHVEGDPEVYGPELAAIMDRIAKTRFATLIE